MAKDRRESITEWATEAQHLSPDALDLNEPAESIILAMDLAWQTAARVDLPFETEPSSFVKLLHNLAPRRTTNE